MLTEKHKKGCTKHAPATPTQQNKHNLHKTHCTNPAKGMTNSVWSNHHHKMGTADFIQELLLRTKLFKYLYHKLCCYCVLLLFMPDLVSDKAYKQDFAQARMISSTFSHTTKSLITFLMPSPANSTILGELN